MRALVIPVGKERYAFPAAQIRQVASGFRSTSVPGAPSWVLGVINVRGEVIPLLDTSVLLGSSTNEAAQFAVVVHSHDGPAALTATGMPQVTTLEGVLGPSEVVGALGRLRIGDSLVVVLDADALLTAARAQTSSSFGSAR